MQNFAQLARHFLRATECNLKRARLVISNFLVFDVQFLKQQTCLNIVFAVIALEKLGFRAFTSLIFPLNFPSLPFRYLKKYYATLNEREIFQYMLHNFLRYLRNFFFARQFLRLKYIIQSARLSKCQLKLF